MKLIFTECDGGTFGPRCINMCGQCAQNEHCHHINGSCLNGCDPGFYENQCIKSKLCTQYSKYIHCKYLQETYMLIYNKYKWKHIHTIIYFVFLSVCETGKYGIDCQQRCSAFCHTSGICHHITGACKDGCKSGWKGAECLEGTNIIFHKGHE